MVVLEASHIHEWVPPQRRATLPGTGWEPGRLTAYHLPSQLVLNGLMPFFSDGTNNYLTKRDVLIRAL